MATIVDHGEFDAEKLAGDLHEAMKGTGTAEDVLIEVLTGFSNKQIQVVRGTYKQFYGEDLIEKLKQETSGHLQSTLVSLTEERSELRARLLNEAIVGAGTNFQQLVDVLAPLEGDQVEPVKAVYKKLFSNELEEDVRGDTSGNVEKTLIAILASGRPGVGAAVDEGKATAEAQELYEKGEGKIGTDQAFFRALFCTRSWAQLGATLKAYNRQRDGTDVETAIKDEFSGNAEALYLAMARRAMEPAAYYANILKKCVEGVGTSDDRLIYTVVLQAEENLHEVKRAYMTLFGETLAADVAGDTSGDYKKALMGLINGNA